MQVLDTAAEERFDRVTRTAKEYFGVQIALISLVDAERQWFKSRQGLEATQTPRSISFCGHAILSDATLIVPDAARDERFADNPLVTGAPHIRFYSGAPLRSATGHRVGTLCIIDDKPRELNATERRTLRDLADWAEEELSNIRLTKALTALRGEVSRKSEFVSTIAHEVRTPLTAIRAALGLVMSGSVGEMSAQARTTLAIADRNATRLANLMDDFLDLDRISHGVHLVLRAQPLMPLVERAVEDNAVLAGNFGCQLTVTHSEPGIWVNVDADRFQQVLGNLLSNAAKFSPAGACVEVAVHADRGRARVEVRDHGPGIPKEFADRLFERFALVDSSDARSRGGAGTGLAIVKALVEAMGGAVHSVALAGNGALMVVELPLHPAAP